MFNNEDDDLEIGTDFSVSGDDEDKLYSASCDSYSSASSEEDAPRKKSRDRKKRCRATICSDDDDNFQAEVREKNTIHP